MNGPKEIGCDPRFVEWLYDEEKNGADALMDYCCYSANMCARFLGLPKRGHVEPIACVISCSLSS